MKETIPLTEAERKRSNIKRKKRRTREQKNRINNEKKVEKGSQGGKMEDGRWTIWIAERRDWMERKET